MASFLDHLPARQEDLVGSRDLFPHYDGVLLAWVAGASPFHGIARASSGRMSFMTASPSSGPAACIVLCVTGPSRNLQALSRTPSITDPASAGARPRMMGSPAASGAITAPPPRFEHSASLATAASARSALRSRPVRRERRDASCRPLREAAAVGARR